MSGAAKASAAISQFSGQAAAASQCSVHIVLSTDALRFAMQQATVASGSDMYRGRISLQVNGGCKVDSCQVKIHHIAIASLGQAHLRSAMADAARLHALHEV